MSGETVRKLYITLRRGFAGTKETQRRTLQSLGLRYREQTVVQDNNSSARGAIDKVGSTERQEWPFLHLMLN
jgi:large subunit ribosomal protein L30